MDGFHIRSDYPSAGFKFSRFSVLVSFTFGQFEQHLCSQVFGIFLGNHFPPLKKFSIVVTEPKLEPLDKISNFIPHPRRHRIKLGSCAGKYQFLARENIYI